MRGSLRLSRDKDNKYYLFKELRCEEMKTDSMRTRDNTGLENEYKFL